LLDVNRKEKVMADFLRKAKAGAIMVLLEAIKQALATVSQADARAWLTHRAVPNTDMQNALV
jgi:ketopantoate hydroxymethyltransferase